MSNDPGLVADSCIFLEAVAGDGGHHVSPTWWLSPDVELTGPVSGPDKADPGMNNPVQVRVHKNNNCNLPDGTGVIFIDLYVCNPSLAIAPNNLLSTKKLTNPPATFATPGMLMPAGVQTTIMWNPPMGATGPESAGHKCLVARCYPDSLTPSATSFFLPDDPHVVQHNICIVPCDAGGGGGMAIVAPGFAGPIGKGGGCSFDVSTVNVNDERAEPVTILAKADLNPSKNVLDVVTPRLKELAGFRRIATTAPQTFSLRMPDFPDAKVTDNTRPGCLGSLLGRGFQPTWQAQIQLKPAQFTTFTFSPDLSKSQSGDAHIFHLTQAGADGRVQGGLTLVMVAL